MNPLTCSKCGQEVRRGWRHGREAWWHREDVDHEPIFGRIFTPEDAAEVERQRHLPRLADDGSTYTVAEWEAQKLKDKKKRGAALAALAEEDETPGAVEQIEVRCTPMPLKGELSVTHEDGTTSTTKVPGGVRTLLNLAEKLGDWDVVRLTYSRGPYLGADGESLGVSDSVVLHLRGPEVDNTRVHALASWRDGKSDWAWKVERNHVERVGARALIAWMKEVPHG